MSILKIYFIQVLLKAVFIQEVLSLMNDWGFPLLPTSPTLLSFFCFLFIVECINVCNFYFLIYNSIFNVLLCAIATFPHIMWREKSIKIIKKRDFEGGSQGFFFTMCINMWKISRVLCGKRWNNIECARGLSEVFFIIISAVITDIHQSFMKVSLFFDNRSAYHLNVVYDGWKKAKFEWKKIQLNFCKVDFWFQCRLAEERSRVW